MLNLTVLGCAGSYPGSQSPASSYLVESATTKVVMDLGSGAMSQLLKVVDPRCIDAFAISHVHGDHCLDLLPLYVHLKYSPVALAAPIPVYGPRELPARLARAYSLSGDDNLRSCFDFRPFPDHADHVTIGDVSLRATRVAHPGESYAMRLESEGASLVYSGDTGECAALLQLAQGANMALFEASFIDPAPGQPALPLDMHMSGTEAGNIARRAGVGSLIITHMVEWNAIDGAHTREQQAATKAFGGPVDVARLGRTFVIHSAD